MKNNPPDGICKTTKAQRHRKLAVFKDRMKSMWGKSISYGIGLRDPNLIIFCPKCNCRIIEYKYNCDTKKLTCKSCDTECEERKLE